MAGRSAREGFKFILTAQNLEKVHAMAKQLATKKCGRIPLC